MNPHRNTGGSRLARIASPIISTGAALGARVGVASIAVIVLATMPVAAQSGSGFCSTQMADTIRNMFTIIQLGGPLLGGVIALGATVALPVIRRADRKKEVKEIRNQGLIYGVLVAPLGTAIITFLLNNVVAGGTSCAF